MGPTRKLFLSDITKKSVRYLLLRYLFLTDITKTTFEDMHLQVCTPRGVIGFTLEADSGSAACTLDDKEVPCAKLDWPGTFSFLQHHMACDLERMNCQWLPLEEVLSLRSNRLAHTEPGLSRYIIRCAATMCWRLGYGSGSAVVPLRFRSGSP